MTSKVTYISKYSSNDIDEREFQQQIKIKHLTKNLIQRGVSKHTAEAWAKTEIELGI